jgi:hypothetical protein
LSAPFLTAPLLKVPVLRLPLSEASPFLSAPFLTVPLLKVLVLHLPLSEALPFSALSIDLPSDFGDLCVDDLVFLTMYDVRFAIAMHAAKPAAVVILLPQLLRAYAAMFAYLHWSPAAAAGWTVPTDYNAAHVHGPLYEPESAGTVDP